jgi:hypothetical protein
MGVMNPATVDRLLTKRKHIALLGTVTALASPAAAGAAQHDGGAEVGNAAAAIGIAEARPAALVPMMRPVVNFEHLVHATATRFRREHRQEVQRRRHATARAVAREEREERREFATLPGGVSIGTLESIAACESGGDLAAVSSDGTYRGKYQFDEGTWESVGGHGDPAAAPELEQDYRAALLYSRSGSSPWPICG